MKNHTTRRKTPSVIFTLVFIVALIMTGCAKVPAVKDPDNSKDDPAVIVKFEGKYIDVHTHISPTGMSLAQIIKNMDAEGIDKMVIMSPPAGINDTQEQ